jgi:hypothetical protein
MSVAYGNFYKIAHISGHKPSCTNRRNLASYTKNQPQETLQEVYKHMETKKVTLLNYQWLSKKEGGNLKIATSNENTEH